jgi:hypothetical protein
LHELWANVTQDLNHRGDIYQPKPWVKISGQNDLFLTKKIHWIAQFKDFPKGWPAVAARMPLCKVDVLPPMLPGKAETAGSWQLSEVRGR